MRRGSSVCDRRGEEKPSEKRVGKGGWWGVERRVYPALDERKEGEGCRKREKYKVSERRKRRA